MTARTLAWFEDDDPRDILRWSMAAAIVVAIHAAAIGGYMFWHQPDDQVLGDETPIISIELTAPQIEQQEQPKVEAPTPPKETSPDAVLPEEKPPEQVQETSPATRNTIHEEASAPRIDPSWAALLTERIKQVESYPSGARARGEVGVVLISVNIGRDGHVLASHVVHSSGHADLDADALAWIARAQPLPAFPASMAQAELDDFQIPLRYKLQ
jgi:periplasmic protein TonB